MSSNRWLAREVDPIDSLRACETEVLSLDEERKLLKELTRCKDKLAKALGEIRQVDDLEHHDEEESPASTRLRLLQTPPDAALGATYRRLVDIRAKLALSNMKLVAHMAKKFRDRGISYSDLIQEGFHGLLEAIDRFELSHGTKLATYATWWIRQSMQQAVASGAYPVRLTPRHLRQLAQSQEGNSHTPGASVSPEDSCTGELINRIHAATRPSISLDSWSDSDSGFNLLQVMGDASTDRVAEIDAGETIDRLMDVLGPREKEVLSLRFGLGGIERLSLSQAGVKLKVSKERIRQIQDRAIQKLRNAALEQNLEAEFALTD